MVFTIWLGAAPVTLTLSNLLITFFSLDSSCSIGLVIWSWQSRSCYQGSFPSWIPASIPLVCSSWPRSGFRWLRIDQLRPPSGLKSCGGDGASWCYALIFLKHAPYATGLSFWIGFQHALDATLFSFSRNFQHALDATIFSFSNYFQHALDARLFSFSSSFQHTLDATIFSQVTFNTLLMYRIFSFSNYFQHALDLTLRCFLMFSFSSSFQHTLDATISYFYQRTFNTLLMYTIFSFSIHFSNVGAGWFVQESHSSKKNSHACQTS